jgi:hypothetical protein
MPDSLQYFFQNILGWAKNKNQIANDRDEFHELKCSRNLFSLFQFVVISELRVHCFFLICVSSVFHLWLKNFPPSIARRAHSDKLSA